jgi:hypothetical protein
MTEGRPPGVTRLGTPDLGRPDPGGRGPDQGVEAPLDPDRPEAIVEDLHDRADDVDGRRGRLESSRREGAAPGAEDPWLREGPDAPDAADIEDPDTQR